MTTYKHIVLYRIFRLKLGDWKASLTFSGILPNDWKGNEWVYEFAGVGVFVDNNKDECITEKERKREGRKREKRFFKYC